MQFVRESLDDILKPKQLSPSLKKRWKQEELRNAAKSGDADRFLRGIDRGLKISYPLFRKMITDWSYRQSARDIFSSVDWSDFEQMECLDNNLITELCALLASFNSPYWKDTNEGMNHFLPIVINFPLKALSTASTV